MITINIEELKPGMILARPVRNRQGVLIMEAGAKITKKSIRIFKSWGVNEIVIKGKPGQTATRPREGQIKGESSIERQLKEKFSDVMDDPIMVAIFNAAVKRLVAESRTSECEDEPS